MIPKRAFFYWSGGEMPWIRRKCIDSFQRLNPDWQVDIYGDDDSKDAVKRSDVFRYEELARNGGWYFDTDILFVKPMDALLEDIGDSDTVICYNNIGSHSVQFFYSVASLACEAGNPFYAKAVEVAHDPDVFNDPDGQSCGVWLFHHVFGSLENFKSYYPDLKFYILHRDAFLPFDVPQSRTLYRDEPAPDLNDNVYGVHWYGGDRSARVADSWTAKDYWADSALGRMLEQ